MHVHTGMLGMVSSPVSSRGLSMILSMCAQGKKEKSGLAMPDYDTMVARQVA